MDKILITGGNQLNGRIKISGAKNSALKLMVASLLTDEDLVLTNLPALHDVYTLLGVLEGLGVDCNFEKDQQKLTLNAGSVTDTKAPYDLVRKMRASILVLGPLLAKHGHADVSLPGGCAIGTRPVDLHLNGLKQLGAEIVLEEGYVKAKAPNGLKGANILFPKVSVGATEHLMMAACLAEGVTVLSNAAREPEIVDLGNCLNTMGAEISGLGTNTITIKGKKKLGGANHHVLADRIETGTYAIAVGMTGGKVVLEDTNIELINSLVEPLARAGVDVIGEGNTITVTRTSEKLHGVDIMTEPYPGFPTDLQAQIMAMLTICDGAGMITETIFENRFMHVPELCRMGANISVHGSSALVRGVPELKGAEVMATDLRASVAMILAGLVAKGTTTMSRIYHLDRGYDNIVDKLNACGADLERVSDS